MSDQKDHYVFSVVMSVYQAEDYITEALDSLLHQTIGFEHIQLILVDDGSTDKSGAICDAYQHRFPEQITVIHKENGGLSSARNTGLRYIKGKYVSFLDPDDKLEPNVMQKVNDFMSANEQTVDICSIPIYLFGSQTGEHVLNNKFRDGTRVIHLALDENKDFFQLSSASAFYRAETARTMQFDDRHAAEDAKENLRILIDKPYLGVVADTKYYYRKHEGSALDRGQYRRNWYLPHLKYYSKWTIDRAKERLGYVPRFVQAAIMYDLEGKILQEKIPNNLLTSEEEKEYRNLILNIINDIDDVIILEQPNLKAEHKVMLLEKKHKKGIHSYFEVYKEEIRESGSTDNGLPNTKEGNADNTKIATGDVLLKLDDNTVGTASSMVTRLEFFSFDTVSKKCVIEGYHTIFGLDDSIDIIPYLLVDNQAVKCTREERNQVKTICLGSQIAHSIGFRAEFSIEKTVSIMPAILIDGILIKKRKMEYGRFFPISDTYSNAYAAYANWMLYAADCGLRFELKNKAAIALREIRLILELWRRNLEGGRKAVFGRLYYHLASRFKRGKIWIISDRILKADDNGEALFLYLSKHKLENVQAVFAISKNTDDYKRLTEYGKCIDAMSLHHKLLHLICDVNISSQADDVTVNPFYGHEDGVRDLLTHQRFVFLQHGITKDDVSAWLNRYSMNISGFITAALPEYRSIVDGDYAYSKDRIWLTGFPRFDRLYHREENKITIMPTWRRYLMNEVDGKTGRWKPISGFYESRYYQFYAELLNSKRLLDAAEQYGYRVQFYPHPAVQVSGIVFKSDERIEMLPLGTSYREVFATSKLIVTDYSSAVFDFVYLRKPIIYCQFDKDELFNGSHVYTKGYFDYERDGFGEVETDLDGLIDRIIEYMRNGCKLTEKYKDRVESFFSYTDQCNSKRVVDKIIGLDGSH